MIQPSQQTIAELNQRIADALKALEEGRIGDVRRILKTGRADPVKPGSEVLDKVHFL